MNEEITVIYCICDDYLNSMEGKAQKWPNEKMTDAETMTTFIVAARFFYGNLERARVMLYEHGYIPQMLSKSRLNRRVHAITDEVWQDLIVFARTSEKHYEFEGNFIIDSFPVAVCRNIRISRARLFQGEIYRGFNASKHEFFYGLKVTVLTTLSGTPVEMILAPGCEHDITALKLLDLSKLPLGSSIYGDAAYNDYGFEDMLLKRGIKLVPDRKSNSKRPHSLQDSLTLAKYRKNIETTFSKISGLIPKAIHAVVARGFELKVIGFVLAATISFCIN